MPQESETKPVGFRIESLNQAAALGTMGVKLWTEKTTVLGGKKDFDETRDRCWYEYEGDKAVPGGFRDKNNTFLDQISASQLIRFHRDGNLVKWAPNHPLYVMISAAVNRDQLLEHLFHTKLHTLQLVLPEDLINTRSEGGFPHYQLYETDEAPQVATVPLLAVSDFDIAVSLITAGFEYVPNLTEVRRSEKGTAFTLRFHHSKELEIVLRALGGDSIVIPPSLRPATISHVFLKNRKRLKQHAEAKAPELILTAPDEFTKINPAARNRAMQMSEDALDFHESTAVQFFGRRTKHH